MSELLAAGPGRANSRSALIGAALAEFTEKGYESATVQGIAVRAGVTTGALYAHFHGKLDLLLATIGVRPIGDFLQDFYQAASGRSPGELALSMGRDMALPQPAETSLLLDVIVLARRDPRLGGTIRRLFGAKLREVVEATDTGREAGWFSPALSSSDLARLMMVIALGKMVLAAIDEEVPSAALFTRLLDAMLWSETPADPAGHPALARVNECAARSKRARLEFEAVVAEAVGEGYSLREVGQAAGVSHEQIRRIVAEDQRATSRARG